jgi:alkanesulfonate monooxygenase SsuD/methylene tetrahydromethanopterin reductase-like flavin-dependent oxidoreductase (luciferase family)
VDYGLSFLPDGAPSTKDPHDYFRDALHLSEIADRAGLQYVKMTEHYLKAYGGYCPSPLTFLAAVSARTSHVRLMTGGILPSFHHPVQTASECTMVDAISGGRLDVGFARAYLPYEFDCFGLDLDQSRARFDASVDLVLRLWTEEHLSVTTPFFDVHDATILPRPTQLPHPPVWVTAVRSRSSFAWIGERGFGLLITSPLSAPEQQADHVSIYLESHTPPVNQPSAQPRVAISLPLYLAPTDGIAIDEGDVFCRRYHQVWAEAADSWNTARSRDYPGYTGMSQAIRAATPEEMRRIGSVIVGSPSRVVDAIHALVDRLPLNAILWQIDFGAMPRDRAQRTLDLFISDVLPRLAGRCRPRAADAIREVQ